jgi:hypothetical protein
VHVCVCVCFASLNIVFVLRRFLVRISLLQRDDDNDAEGGDSSSSYAPSLSSGGDGGLSDWEHEFLQPDEDELQEQVPLSLARCCVEFCFTVVLFVSFENTKLVRSNDKDGLIFLVDCRKSMFEKTPDGKVPFQVVMQCAVEALSLKIINSDTDCVGVCFFGSKQKKNSNDFENIYVHCPLDRPSAQMILSLETLASN